MSTATKLVTLLEYANERENVIVFWSGFGMPAGAYHAAGYREFDSPFAEDWDNLLGEIDEDGDWRWNGDGDVRDGWQNSVYKIHAYIDALKWQQEIDEYMAETE